MAKKKRQRISYVLPLASTPGGHRLGINGLSFDHERDILYTGGRDGVICAWDLNLKAEYSQEQDKSLPSTRKTATFRRQVQAHTHWVNDIVLVKNDLAVVSASSDASVKLWRPHSHDAASTYSIGSHSDYIKCLTTPDRTSNWVASGGLDHRVCLWDLGGGGQTLEINIKKADNGENIVKGSVYALKARGSVIASGGPESVVRLWDVNTGKSITKLVGHTDNIRDILMSEDGDTILTASSDQTIKVWSMAAGRCIHTLTMHNDSVWCMYSDDPTLSVFYSGDKSGLVAKTDTRRAMEIDDGVSVAVCQEHDGIARLAITGDSIWTATSNSSINRWLDVNTELEVETPPLSPKHERGHSTHSRSLHSATPSLSALKPQLPITNGISETNGVNETSETSETNGTGPKRIPHNAILRLSNTASHPGRRGERNYSVSNLRKASEVMMDTDIIFITPIRGHPDETIEGQNGLTKHIMLNDKKRVLTIDTAGEVVLWDLLKCVPIRSFGRKHLDEVVPQVNTTESVANWCTVDTKTGKLTVMLEENYAFDAEVYADEIDIAEKIDFREDQRINLGKWVLRNLFMTLVDEEIKRDEVYRRTIRTQSPPAPPPVVGGISRLGAPRSILLPTSQGTTPAVSPGTAVTPRARNGNFVPYTPGLAIGLATPGGGASITSPMSPSALSSTAEEGFDLEKRLSSHSQRPATQDHSKDYFSSSNNPPPLNTGVIPPETSVDAGLASPGQQDSLPALSPSSPTDERKKGMLFGKKFQMNFPKKLGRTSGDTAKGPATTEEKSEESDRSSDKEEHTPKVFEDNFYGILDRIRHQYLEGIEADPDQPLPVGIVPSLPVETPVLKPPPHTLIIIQEDNPESGGLADQYRGEISELGREADTLEKIAPSWLGELLLRNELPPKETVKVSFILVPFEDKLPAISNPTEANARLNANRMLRAKKIIAYICERIEAPPAPPQTMTNEAGQIVTMLQSEEDRLRPEEYLELICQGQKVDPNTTLATLRVHVWRTGGDVLLYYRANGRKQIKIPHPADVATRDEGMGTQVTNV